MANTEPYSAALAANVARGLVRRSNTATLATLHHTDRTPYASLVQVATSQICEPVLLLSDLALHARNLAASPRASLLFAAAPEAGADPLDQPRVTLMGEIARDDAESGRGRFLRRYPKAVDYAGFGDFGFYRLLVESAHFIGGFGRIETIAGKDLMVPAALASEITEAEPAILAHMNDDHPDALALYAAAFLGESGGPWRLVGCDADGCDLAGPTGLRRLDFERRVERAQEFRVTFTQLAEQARQRAGDPA